MIEFSNEKGFFKLTAHQKVKKNIYEVFSFFETPKNLNLLTPPWLNFKIKNPVPNSTYIGLEISYKLYLHKIPMNWKSRIITYKKNKYFCDKQILGPYLFWEHNHKFIKDGENTIIHDFVDYKVPLGRLINILFVKNKLKKIFEYRYKKIEELFKR